MTDMRLVPKTIAAIAASAALLASSTLAAAAPAPQAQPAQAATPDAWMMLSTLSAAQSVGLAGANAAVQPTDVPPPPVAAGAMADGAGEIIPFVLWFGLIAIALSISGSAGGSAVITPNSAG
jgi:hypothetical protein